MGTAQRKPNSALIERLMREPGSFEFFQAVRMLEAHLAVIGGRRAARRVGFDHTSLEVGLRFGVAASLSFPSRALATVKEETQDPPGRSAFSCFVTFLGLTGSAGTLPTSYSEMLLHRLHEKDPALRDFLDVFQDRSTAFFYRAWKKYRPSFSYAEGDLKRGKPDPVLGALLGVVGLLPLPDRQPMAPAELAQVFHAGHFSNRRRSANGLQALMSGLIGCPVRVEQFVGQWMDIDRDAWSRLGHGPGPGMPAKLGDESVLGARAWCVDAKIRVIAGPLQRAQFRRLWPGGQPVLYLWETLRAYLGPLIECDLVWELDPDAPAPLQLGGDQRLGRDCWLGWCGTAGPDLRVISPPWHISSPVDAKTARVSA